MVSSTSSGAGARRAWSKGGCRSRAVHSCEAGPRALPHRGGASPRLWSPSQVQGAAGYAQLFAKVRIEGMGALWAGAIGNAIANFVGNYPWYLTFNALDELWVT